MVHLYGASYSYSSMIKGLVLSAAKQANLTTLNTIGCISGVLSITALQ